MLAELLHRNWVWFVIIAVVAIQQWSKCHEWEVKSRENLRLRELDHQQRMRELEAELEKTRSSSQRT